MCWRRGSKLQKAVFIILFYFTVYILISFAMSPDIVTKFVRQDMTIGDKYALVFLIAPNTPVFSDAEAADVFKSRRCGQCVLTNNIGFIPMSEYDAVLMLGEKDLLYETPVFMEPEKRYLIQTSRKCLRNKMRNCALEPKITAFSTKESFDLCALCDHLLQERKRYAGSRSF